MNKPLNKTENIIKSKLGINTWRELSKDKVIALFQSNLPKLDPGVAKEALHQFPHFKDITIKSIDNLKDVINRGFDSLDDTGKQAIGIQSKILDSLKEQLNDPNLPEETREKIIDKFGEIGSNVNEIFKDKKEFAVEARKSVEKFAWAALSVGGAVLGVSVGLKLGIDPQELIGQIKLKR